MNIGELLDFTLSMQAVEESFPFGENVLVLKVKGKMFLTISLNSIPLQFNAKCDPERAISLREEYEDILPGYHMNKKHWNTILLNGTIPPQLIRELITHSYELVCPKPKKNSS
jgi:predicted DNA-binding protein (MmcQ/YjbR family)